MIVIIAAVAKNNVIGIGNDLPWDIPEDLQHFKDLTRGKTVLMGGNTFKSIVSRLGRPLPKRKNIIVSNEPDFKVPEGVVLFDSLDKAREAFSDKEMWVIGGASIYKQMLPYADVLYITHVNQEPEGDTYFPEISPSEWKKVEEDKHSGFSFCKYVRK